MLTTLLIEGLPLTLPPLPLGELTALTNRLCTPMPPLTGRYQAQLPVVTKPMLLLILLMRQEGFTTSLIIQTPVCGRMDPIFLNMSIILLTAWMFGMRLLESFTFTTSCRKGEW